MYYREDKAGQVLQEGINEPGGMSSWIAAATSYSTNNRIMVPFYVYYSMFGFQRVGDLAWAAGDMQARGFLLGGTSGRTTLNGEGLQHEDGHSHILAGTIPNCISYDPTFAHEVGVILHHGLKRMVEKQDNVFFYLTLLNENYAAAGPAAPAPRSEIIKGMYLLQEGAKKAPRVNLLGSGTILRESRSPPSELLENDWGIAANVWSCPSFNQLARDGQDVRALEPAASDREAARAVRRPAAREVRRPGDRVDRLHEELRRADPRLHLPKGRTYKVLGTDGFGRSDFRTKLREHFEVNRHYIVVAALKALAEEGSVPAAKVAEAIAKYGIDADKINPLVRLKRPRRQEHGHGGSEGAGHRRLQGRRGHRGAGQAGRPDQGRAVAGHGRERQGVDGDSVERRRRGEGDEGQARRQGQRGLAAAGAGGRGRRRRPAPHAAPAAAPAAAASAARRPRRRPRRAPAARSGRRQRRPDRGRRARHRRLRRGRGHRGAGQAGRHRRRSSRA